MGRHTDSENMTEGVGGGVGGLQLPEHQDDFPSESFFHRLDVYDFH